MNGVQSSIAVDSRIAAGAIPPQHVRLDQRVEHLLAGRPIKREPRSTATTMSAWLSRMMRSWPISRYSSGTGGGVYRAGGAVSKPRVIKDVKPRYTGEALIHKIQGRVLLEAAVTAAEVAKSAAPEVETLSHDLRKPIACASVRTTCVGDHPAMLRL
jgi:hypothetical protein